LFVFAHAEDPCSAFVAAVRSARRKFGDDYFTAAVVEKSEFRFFHRPPGVDIVTALWAIMRRDCTELDLDTTNFVDYVCTSLSTNLGTVGVFEIDKTELKKVVDPMYGKPLVVSKPASSKGIYVIFGWATAPSR
jgi:hypothetical protein